MFLLALYTLNKPHKILLYSDFRACYDVLISLTSRNNLLISFVGCGL